MKRLIIGLYAVPGLLTIGASLELMEQTLVILWGGLAYGVTLVITCFLVGFARYKGQRFRPVLAAAIASLTVIASVATLHWPLRRIPAFTFLSREAGS